MNVSIKRLSYSDLFRKRLLSSFYFIAMITISHCHRHKTMVSKVSRTTTTSNQPMLPISRFDMSCAQAHRARSKPILRVMQLKLHKPTMAIGHSLRMCARLADSTNAGRCNKLFRSKPIRKLRCRIGL